MQLRKITLTNAQVQHLYQIFNEKMLAEGLSPLYSLFIYNNLNLLIPIYENITSRLFDERREPEFANLTSENNALVIKYADKDEQGNIVKDQNGNPKITENIVEFNNENTKLIQKYKSLYDKMQNKYEINAKILSETHEHELFTLNLSEFPDKTPPFIIGLFANINSNT